VAVLSPEVQYQNSVVFGLHFTVAHGYYWGLVLLI
jgi:hypothetical protein